MPPQARKTRHHQAHPTNDFTINPTRTPHSPTCTSPNSGPRQSRPVPKSSWPEQGFRYLYSWVPQIRVVYWILHDSGILQFLYLRCQDQGLVTRGRARREIANRKKENRDENISSHGPHQKFKKINVNIKIQALKWKRPSSPYRP